MNDKKEKGNLKLYGVVEGHKNILFVIDDFQCVFMNSEIDKKETEAISFKGGVLNKLFFKSALKFDYSDRTKLIYNNDSKKCSLTNEKVKGEMQIHSIISESVSIEKGNSITTGGTELEITFAEKKDVKSFSELFGYILSLCQFLTFRKNIRFEKVVLEERSRRYPEINETIADCFVRYDDEQETEKRIMNCITFNDIGDGIDKLLNSIVSNKPKKPQFNVGFIPENDKDVNFITSMKI